MSSGGEFGNPLRKFKLVFLGEQSGKLVPLQISHWFRIRQIVFSFQPMILSPYVERFINDTEFAESLRYIISVVVRPDTVYATWSVGTWRLDLSLH